jgi:hypothetical protein
MSYKDYIEKAIQELTDRHIIKVVEEINYNYNPKDNEIMIVIKELSGSVIGDVKFLPIQFNVFSSANEVNETMAILEMFVANYSNSHTMLGMDYVKQDYSTPVAMNNFLQIGHSKRTEIFIGGTLLITKNICDITKVSINGKEINYTNVAIAYSSQPNAAKTTKDNLQKVMIADGNVQITLSSYSQIGPFNTMLSLLRQGKKGLNDSYTIDLEYTDGTEEQYTCKILSYNGNHDRTNPATRSVVFVVC